MNYRKMLLATGLVALLNAVSVQAQQPAATNDSTLAPVKSLAMMAASVPCSDVDRSVAFYTKGLGMTVRGRLEMGKVIEIPLLFPGGGAYLLLQHPKAEGTPPPIRSSLNRIGLVVPDLKALEAQLKAAGYQLKGPIHEMAQYKVAVAFVEDPDGNQIELVQPTQ